MDAERIAAIRARLDAATPGPWYWAGDYPSNAPCPHTTEWTDHGPDLMSRTVQKPWGGDTTVITSSGYDASSLNVEDADAELIAHAPQDLAFLLAEVERLQSLRPALHLSSYGAGASMVVHTAVPEVTP